MLQMATRGLWGVKDLEVDEVFHHESGIGDISWRIQRNP